MTGQFLKADDIELFISEGRFELANQINDRLLMKFKNDRSLLVKIPIANCDKNPFDGYCWSKSVNVSDGQRHQPTYTQMEIFAQKVTTLRCTEFSQKHVKKHVIPYNEYRYVYYFTTSDLDIQIPSDGTFEVRKKGIEKRTAEILKREVLPHRNLSGAMKVANDMGLFPSNKQLRNLARSSKTTLISKTGPRSRTSLAMVLKIAAQFPDRISYKHSGNVLNELTYIRVFDESVKLFMMGCPEHTKWENWLRYVDQLQQKDEKMRKHSIRKLLKKHPDGVVFPSRVHVDTTFNLGDVYVTIALGECNNFKSKESGKYRVLPLGFMLHSSKSTDTHQKFADALRDICVMHDDLSRSRRIPVVLIDGEESLETYGEALSAHIIRCDFHILSLLRHNYGGATAAQIAKPFLFGRKMTSTRNRLRQNNLSPNNNSTVWKSGVFGVFTMQKLKSRLEKIRGKVDQRIFDWVHDNRRMLLNHASAYAKLKGGHILQFSTNNQNECFNNLIKLKLTRRHTTPELIDRLETFCEEKIQECWYAALNVSQYVSLSEDVSRFTVERKIDYFKSIGLSMPLILGLNIPQAMARAFNRERMMKEVDDVTNLRFEHRGPSVCVLEHLNPLATDINARFSSVSIDGDIFECQTCGKTYPEYLCSHVIFCLRASTHEQRDFFWLHLQRPQPAQVINTFSKMSGSKPSDRLGNALSSGNHHRTMGDISSLSIFNDSDASLGSQNITLLSSTTNDSMNFSISTTATTLTPPASTNSSALGSANTSYSTPTASVDSSARRLSRRMRRPRLSFSPSASFD